MLSALFAFLAAVGVGCGSSSPATPADGGGGAGLDAGSGGDDLLAEAAPLPEADAAVEAAPDLPVERPAPISPYPGPDYHSLSETGLYDDFAGQRLAAELLAFEPTHKLWSDGAEKRRWLKLPPGGQIDTSDMDHWVFPVGTKLFKEFSLGGVLLETRLIERYGTGSEDYWFGAFVWNAAQTEAIFAVDGQADINNTAHDAPSQKNCGACHRGDIGRVLGFSAIQLSRSQEPPTLKSLAAQDLLTHPPAGGVDFPVPGDPVTARAFGYLHANCGHCHNINGTSWPDTQMVLRLRVGEQDVRGSELFTSVVGKDVQYFRGGDDVRLRVSPGNPAASALIVRMESRTVKIQMPPLASEIIDPDGLGYVRDWITALAP